MRCKYTRSWRIDCNVQHISWLNIWNTLYIPVQLCNINYLVLGFSKFLDFFYYWLAPRYHTTSIVNGILTVSSTQILILSLYIFWTSYVWTYDCMNCVVARIRISFWISSFPYTCIYTMPPVTHIYIVFIYFYPHSVMCVSLLSYNIMFHIGKMMIFGYFLFKSFSFRFRVEDSPSCISIISVG